MVEREVKLAVLDSQVQMLQKCVLEIRGELKAQEDRLVDLRVDVQKLVAASTTLRWVIGIATAIGPAIGVGLVKILT